MYFFVHRARELTAYLSIALQKPYVLIYYPIIATFSKENSPNFLMFRYFRPF